jgi:flagellar motor switch protein FliG
MYSPKIKDELIPILYKMAKQEGIPMTKLVDEMLRAEIAKRAGQIHQVNNEAVSVRVKKTADDGGS